MLKKLVKLWILQIFFQSCPQIIVHLNTVNDAPLFCPWLFVKRDVILHPKGLPCNFVYETVTVNDVQKALHLCVYYCLF